MTARVVAARRARWPLRATWLRLARRNDATVTGEDRKLGSPLVLGLFGAVSAFWLIDARFGNDALLYREAAAQLVGGAPWSSVVGGYSYAAPPLQAVPFLPFLGLSPVAFLAIWLSLSAVAGAWIVRTLQLGPAYLLFPPLVFGVALGNPAIVGMACVLAGVPVIGLILRPHLALVASRRALIAFAVLSGLAIALRPDYLVAVGDVVRRYAAESRSINFWATPLMIPAALALVLLARTDRAAAAWLVMPAIGPAMGWYGFAMVLPIRSRALAVACALPIPFLGATAIVVYCCLRMVGRATSHHEAIGPAGSVGAGPGRSTGRPPDPVTHTVRRSTGFGSGRKIFAVLRR
jgi:hypothetical protein